MAMVLVVLVTFALDAKPTLFADDPPRIIFVAVIAPVVVTGPRISTPSPAVAMQFWNVIAPLEVSEPLMKTQSL
jgi:hypothetical protein